MPIYEFRCTQCGDFEATHPMSTAPKKQPCPVCGEDARKLFSPANLSTLNSSRARAIDSAARTAETPDVVSGPVGRGRPIPTTNDPRHLKLPRP